MKVYIGLHYQLQASERYAFYVVVLTEFIYHFDNFILDIVMSQGEQLVQHVD